MLARPSQVGTYQFQDPLKSEESEPAIEELLLGLLQALLYWVCVILKFSDSHEVLR